jgi:hypothetical protein
MKEDVVMKRVMKRRDILKKAGMGAAAVAATAVSCKRMPVLSCLSLSANLE